jgi:exonuclease III
VLITPLVVIRPIAFLDRFLAKLVQMKNEGHRIVVCGDYNIAHRDIDVFDPKSCAAIRLARERLWRNEP